MHVGEILLAHGWVDPPSLARALAEQRMTGKRLCSLLIARGLLDPDHAALALAEQHAVAAALQKHLLHRDRALAPLLPAAVARGHVALPLGRLRAGDLIVCARDPRPALLAQLQAATRERIVLAVAAATQLEQLVEQSYEAVPATSDDFEVDVDLSTQSIPVLDDLGPDPAEFTLADLDDVRVTKDFSLTAPVLPRAPTPLAHPASRSSLSSLAVAAEPVLLDDALAGLANASSRDAATDLAMRFAAGRWASALLLTIKEGAALGHRGHGGALSPEAVHAVALPLSSPSLVKQAHATRHLASDARPSAIQDRLRKLLGMPDRPIAAAVTVGTKVACVLVVGDPLADAATSASDLERLTGALGDAYARIVRDAKR